MFFEKTYFHNTSLEKYPNVCHHFSNSYPAQKKTTLKIELLLSFSSVSFVHIKTGLKNIAGVLVTNTPSSE